MNLWRCPTVLPPNLSSTEFSLRPAQTYTHAQRSSTHRQGSSRQEHARPSRQLPRVGTTVKRFQSHQPIYPLVHIRSDIRRIHSNEFTRKKLGSRGSLVFKINGHYSGATSFRLITMISSKVKKINFVLAPLVVSFWSSRAKCIKITQKLNSF